MCADCSSDCETFASLHRAGGDAEGAGSEGTIVALERWTAALLHADASEARLRPEIARALQAGLRPLLSIGARGTGTHFHAHAPTWFVLVRGLKVWLWAAGLGRRTRGMRNGR